MNIATTCKPMNGIIPAKIWLRVTCGGETPFRSNRLLKNNFGRKEMTKCDGRENHNALISFVAYFSRSRIHVLKDRFSTAC